MACCCFKGCVVIRWLVVILVVGNTRTCNSVYFSLYFLLIVQSWQYILLLDLKFIFLYMGENSWSFDTFSSVGFKAFTP